MKLLVGKYSGFCNGVKYTVTKTKEELEKNEKLYSLGELVHNEEVINDLKNKGLLIKDSILDIPDNSRVIIRAHGEPLETYELAKKKNIELIDLTCGKVKLIHTKINNKKTDYFIIIIGKKTHPETIAHKSYSDNTYVVEDLSDISDSYEIFKNSNLKSIYVVAQTTFNSEKFDKIVDEIKKIYNDYPIIVDKTICNTTNLRQDEAFDISKKVDKMIIIGGKNSSNTKELEIIAKRNLNDVYLIQTYHDLDNYAFDKNDIVGIVAGASTPFETIERVIDYLQKID